MTEQSGVHAVQITNALMESLADTTAHRDRDSLNAAIAQLLLEFLDADSVTVHRLVEHHQTVRALPLVAAIRGTQEIQALPAEAPSSLKILRDTPFWSDCVRLRRAVQYKESSASGLSAVAVFPVESARDVIGLMVLRCAKELETRELHLGVCPGNGL